MQVHESNPFFLNPSLVVVKNIVNKQHSHGNWSVFERGHEVGVYHDEAGAYDYVREQASRIIGLAREIKRFHTIEQRCVPAGTPWTVAQWSHVVKLASGQIVSYHHRKSSAQDYMDSLQKSAQAWIRELGFV